MGSAIERMDQKPTTREVWAVEFAETGYQLSAHCHSEAQRMLVVRGLVTCEIAMRQWMVPPECALWIPERMAHSMRGVGNLQLCCVYVDAKLTQRDDSAGMGTQRWDERTRIISTLGK